MHAQTIIGRLELLLLGGAAILVGPHAAYAQERGVTVLEQISVEAESDDILVQDGYVAKQDRIGAKIDTPIAEIPQAIP